MKKVYFDIRITIAAVLGFFLSAWAFLNSHSPSFSNYFYLILFLVFLLICIFFNLFPLFKYGEEGIEFYSKMKMKRFGWLDIKSISGSGYRATLTTKTGDFIYMTSFGTSNFFGVLTDLVFYLKKNKSDGKVSESVLKWIEKPPKFYI